MAGDWIKVETCTPGKAEIIRLARLLSMKHDEAFGVVIRFWMWADSNTVDGHVDGVASTDVDTLLSCPGLCSALESVGWLEIDRAKERIKIPKFDRHNGDSAKNRALRNRRQAKWRNANVDAPPSTKASTREEKRRDIPHTPSGGFLKFWGSWPRHSRKQSRGSCWERWRKQDLDQVAEQIVAHVEAMKLSIDWRKDSGAFIPAPLVYLNQRRWEGAELNAEPEKRMVV